MSKERFRLDPKTGEFVSVYNRETGQEIPDPTPMAPPVGFERRVPLHERIRAMVEHHLRQAGNEELETPEEADDFLVGDEDDPRYGERFAVMPGHEHEWEENYEPPKDFKEMRDRLLKAGWTAPTREDEIKEELIKQGYKPPSEKPKRQEKSAVQTGKSEDDPISLDGDGQE